jgi:serine protease Do
LRDKRPTACMVFSIRTLAVCLAVSAFAVTGYSQTPAHSATLRRIVERGHLGVGVIELTEDRAKTLGLKDDNGVEVTHVEENSAASKAGLKVGDVILEVNGKTVENVEQFIRAISEEVGGSKVSLTVWRSGAKRTMTATLDSRQDNPFFGLSDGAISSMPPMPPMPGGMWDGNTPLSSLTGSGALIGFEGETLSPQLAEFFGVKDGVLVRTVGPKTPAEKAGLKAGDVVIKVNGTPVSTPREISGLARANRSKIASLTVVRNKKEITLNVEIAELRLPVFFNEVL